MAIRLLSIHDLRNIQTASLEPCERLNLIFGPNGSGKTSILEAIYLLGRGKSFRSAYSRRIIRREQSSLTVFGKTLSANDCSDSLGIQIKEGKFRAKINGEIEKKSSNLASLLPLLLISPDADKLIKGSPRQRRRFIDWGLFHVEHEFLPVWQRYNRILLQRNSALRQNNGSVLDAWNDQLVEAALKLDQFRRGYLTQLVEQTQCILPKLLEIEACDFRYQPGWPISESYGAALIANVDSDIKAGFTQRGPHRAELSMRVVGRPAAEFLSGGQQKLAACSLLLAQASVFNLRREENCILLVDDLPAELDTRHRAKFMDLLYSIGGQVFVTATDASSLDISGYPNKQMFHVEHGVITAEKRDGN